MPLLWASSRPLTLTDTSPKVMAFGVNHRLVVLTTRAVLSEQRGFVPGRQFVDNATAGGVRLAGFLGDASPLGVWSVGGFGGGVAACAAVICGLPVVVDRCRLCCWFSYRGEQHKTSLLSGSIFALRIPMRSPVDLTRSAASADDLAPVSADLCTDWPMVMRCRCSTCGPLRARCGRGF